MTLDGYQAEQPVLAALKPFTQEAMGKDDGVERRLRSPKSTKKL